MATFQSLGVVLYTMVSELHWSQTAAGFSFTFLGLACGLTSPLPGWSVKALGCRPTMCVGAGLLAIGFYLSAIAHAALTFYVAMTFLGMGYSFMGNVPGVYSIATWFQLGSSRVIGFYMMLGALGAAVGPPVVDGIVSVVGWRGNWQFLAFVAIAMGVISFLLVREPGARKSKGLDGVQRRAASAALPSEWTQRQAVGTSQFLLIACAMAATMACVTTYSSMAVTHLVMLGTNKHEAAFILGVIGITATVLKAASGRLCEMFVPTHIVSVGLVLQAAGSVMLAFADNEPLRYASALTFGTGWGLAYVAGTVVLLNYFGPVTGARILSIVWLITTIAAAGPIGSGMIADRYGTFVPIFLLYTVMLLALAVPIHMMRRPVAPVRTEHAEGEALQPRFARSAKAV